MSNLRVLSAALDLRAGPGTDYAVLATMPHGTRVTEQIASTAGWIEVRRQDTGQVGWCAMEYLLPASSAAAPPAPAPAATRPSAPAPPPAAPSPSPASAVQPAQSGLCYRPSRQVLDSGGSAVVFDVSHFQGDVDAAAAYGARVFVSRVHDKTGKWPGVYGASYLRELLGTTQDPILGNCWLWLLTAG